MPKIKSKRIDALRDQLLTAQTQLISDKSFALAIVVTGVPTAGRSEVVNQLVEWLDPKHVTVHALDELQHADDGRPPMQRYWLTLPARGQIAIYFMGWYEDLLAPALHTPKKARRTQLRVIERIKQLETMLTHDRIRIVKLDLRVDHNVQKERIAALRADKSTRWRVTHEDRWLAKHYDRVREASDRAIAATDGASARWHIVNGKDPEGRLLSAGTIVLKELKSGLKAAVRGPSASSWLQTAKIKRPAFRTRASAAPLSDDVYDTELQALQRRLALLSRKDAFSKRSVVLAFEGMDAAGKGGVIRRLTSALDARQYSVVPVSAPSAEELAHPYLWRFWKQIPARGDFTIFDRSWYGRVLVERVRDLAADADWQRAYDEINEFELQLTESRIIVHKFWLAVGKDEQLQRFKDREGDSLKRFKVDREDWANRRFYDDYQIAARDMIERTNKPHAPWTIIEADDKKFARLKVLRTFCETIERSLKKPS
jgi:AMP-polyphosphate phosphotransferase